ncbi:MAG: peptidoglycan-associated lipoprotein Pal [Gemmatimonadaceae bacterium]|nr:peptidoglycan-associated lipoprotein Pal [Gemmatimonadaceae bacterium]
MLKKILAAATIAISITAAAGSAQEKLPPERQGAAEIGVFAQYTHFDKNAGCPCDRPTDVWGAGARVGYFVTDRWEPEVDAQFSRPTRAVIGGTMRYTTASVRLNYNFVPQQSRVSALLGVGPVYTQYSDENAWGASGLAGVRFKMSDAVALRGDGIADYTPSTKNLNLIGRIGVSLFVGGRRRAVPAMPAPPPPPPVFVEAPVPSPVTPPPPTPIAVTPPPSIDTAAITAPIYFDFDQAAIRPDAQAILERKVPWLRGNPSMQIRIEGNTDERGSDEYNLALGQRRAASAKAWLVAKGVSALHLAIVSHGEEHPICTGHDEACWQQNRRDDFVILSVGPGGILLPQR